MIIKKRRFKYQKKYRGKWPFTVDEVTLLLVHVPAGVPAEKKEPIKAFAIVHMFGTFALSGVLEQHGFESIQNSGIWADNPEIPDTKKSLSPFFEFVKEQAIAWSEKANEK